MERDRFLRAADLLGFQAQAIRSGHQRFDGSWAREDADMKRNAEDSEALAEELRALASQPAQKGLVEVLTAPFSSPEAEQLFDDICNAAHDENAAARLMGIADQKPAQPQAEGVGDKGPWHYGVVADGRAILQSDDFTHDVRLYITGDFADEAQLYEYGKALARQLNTTPRTGIPATPHGKAQAGETPRTDAQLVRDVTRLSQELVDLRHDIERQVQIGADLANEVESLRAQLAAQQADAERYRFLRDVAPRIGNRVPHVTQYPPADFDGDKYLLMQIDKWGMDAAIDAALQAGDVA